MNQTRRFLFKIPVVLVTAVFGLTAAFILQAFLGMNTAVLAQPSSDIAPPAYVPLRLPLQQQHDFIFFGVVFTDPALLGITDLAGTPVGTARHTGEVRCKDDNCQGRVELVVFNSTGSVYYTYRMKHSVALNPETRRSVVEGTGTIFGGMQKERFRFTATYEDKGDGTLLVRYEASRADASFLIADAPGRVTFMSRP